MLRYSHLEQFVPERLISPLIRAEDSLARLDERLRLSPLKEGWQARMSYRTVCASRLAEGELVHLEDLVLVDAGAYQGRMSPELSAAWQSLRIWRRACDGDAARLLQLDRPGEEADLARVARKVPEYFFESDWNEPERLAAWRRVVSETKEFPPVLAACTVMDAWRTLEPEQRGSWRASLIAALTLRARDKTHGWLLPIDLGIRPSQYRYDPRDRQLSRIEGLLAWITHATERSRSELETLSLTAALLQERTRTCRTSSRLPALVELLLARPLVTIAMAARRLRCSHQAVEAMLPRLGSIPREMTGRKRFRAWSV